MTPREEAQLLAIFVDVAADRPAAATEDYLAVLVAGLNACWASTLIATLEQSVWPAAAPRSPSG